MRNVMLLIIVALLSGCETTNMFSDFDSYDCQLRCGVYEPNEVIGVRCFPYFKDDCLWCGINVVKKLEKSK